MRDELVEERVEEDLGTWRDDGPVAVVAAAAAVLVWGLARVSDVDLAVRSGTSTHQVGAVSVVVTASVVTLAAGGLRRALVRRTARGAAIWLGVALLAWAVSFAGPAGAVTRSAGLVLAAVHLVVGAVVIVGLSRRAADRVA